MSGPFWDVGQLRSGFAGNTAAGESITATSFDSEGFLRDLTLWTPALADDIARCLQIAGDNGLSAEQRRILLAAREFYQRYQRMPTTRAFVKHLGLTLGDNYASSAALMRYFPNYPMRLVALCAGLPKPPNCF